MSPPLTIGLVARCLNTPHIRGMGRYVFELLRQSLSRTDVEWRLFGNDPRFPMSAPQDRRISPEVFNFRGDRFLLWEQVGLPVRARRRRVDVLHCTEGTLPLWQPCPTVVTLHDTLAWQEHDGGVGTRIFLETVMPAALRRCAAVITPSESSRSDILARWPWLESRVTVIPYGIAEEYLSEETGPLPAVLSQHVGDAPYVMYVGGPLARKRFQWARDIVAGHPDRGLHLIACGFDAKAAAAASERVPDVLRGRVHFAPFLSDLEMRLVYRGARAVLYPTLYEGFGFPAVEAQAAGVPTIFSAVGSLTDLIGPLAFMVPPQDLGAWRSALARALSMGERRQQQAAEARLWARRFSWSATFDRHMAVYQRVRAQQRGS